MAAEDTSRSAAAQAAVLRTRDWPVLKTLYRLAYRVSLALFSIAFNLTFGRCGALYLRRGMASGDWTPGVSDIDLLAILDSAGSEPESRSIQKLWRLYGAFKRIFPFFGELQIAAPPEIAAYARWGGYRAREMRRWRLLCGMPSAMPFAAAPQPGPRLFYLQEALSSYLSLAQLYFETAGRRSPPAFGFKARKFFIDVARFGRACLRDGEELASRERQLDRLAEDGRLTAAEILRKPQKVSRNDVQALLLEAMTLADKACAGYFPASKSEASAIAPPEKGLWRDLAEFKDPDPELWSGRLSALKALDLPGGAGFFMDSLFRWFVVLDSLPAPEKFSGLAGLMDRWHLHDNAFAAPGWVLTYRILQGLMFSPHLDSPFLAFALGPRGSAEKAWVLKHGREFPLWDKYYRLQWNVDLARLFAPRPDDLAALSRQAMAEFALSEKTLALDSSHGHNAYRLFFLLSRLMGPRVCLKEQRPCDAQDMGDLLKRFAADFPDARPWLARLEAQWLKKTEAEVNGRPPGELLPWLGPLSQEIPRPR